MLGVQRVPLVQTPYKKAPSVVLVVLLLAVVGGIVALAKIAAPLGDAKGRVCTPATEAATVLAIHFSLLFSYHKPTTPPTKKAAKAMLAIIPTASIL